MTAQDFNSALARLRSLPRYTKAEVAAGAARPLGERELASVRAIAGDMPDLVAMLEMWVHSDRPLTDQDLSVMRQAHRLWRAFASRAFERAAAQI